jgi:hypothetical protein
MKKISNILLDYPPKEREDVSKGFQGPNKHGNKKGELSLYEKFNTKRGGCIAVKNQTSI